MCKTIYNKKYILKILKMKHTNSYIQIEKEKKRELYNIFVHVFNFSLTVWEENMSYEHFCHF